MQNLHSKPDARERPVFAASIVLAVALLLFLSVACLVVTGSTATIDTDVDAWLHQRASPLLTEGLTAISFLGAPTTLSTVAVIGSLLLLFRRRYTEAVSLSISVLGGNLLNVGLKHLFQRGRPAFDDPILSLPTYSFPSGHAMASTVFYGLVAVYAAKNAEGRSGTWGVTVIAAAMVALVCFSRLYLGLHYLSDVLGGVAEGIAWLAACWAGWHVAGRGMASGVR